MRSLRFVLVPGFVAILIFFSIEFFEQSTGQNDPIELTEIVDIEGYSEGIDTILFDIQGNVDYTLQARRQVSYMNNVTEVEDPFIQLYRDGLSHWRITANSGKISSFGEKSADINQIDLIGDVEVYSLDDQGSRTVLATEFLSVDPTDETLVTDLPVTMTSKDFQQSAIGMRVNLNNDEYIFYRDIRGRYASQ